MNIITSILFVYVNKAHVLCSLHSFGNTNYVLTAIMIFLIALNLFQKWKSKI